MAVLPPAIVNLHRKNNAATAERWDLFDAHRARVTALALQPGATLAVLGAGNCNDLDLAALAGHFRQIHLIDLDGGALKRARDRQPALADRLVVHGGVDLSGALGRLAAFKSRPPTAQDLGRLPAASAAQVLAAVPGPFDVVVSACLLSQLMHSCFAALGGKSPHLNLVACALAVAHLRSMVRMIAPGGTGVIVTDVVSSETYALEELWADQSPGALLAKIDREDRAFSGTAPTFLQRILTEDTDIAPLVAPPRLVEPWLWRFSDQLTLLAYALVFGRR